MANQMRHIGMGLTALTAWCSAATFSPPPSHASEALEHTTPAAPPRSCPSMAGEFFAMASHRNEILQACGINDASENATATIFVTMNAACENADWANLQAGQDPFDLLQPSLEDNCATNLAANGISPHSHLRGVLRDLRGIDWSINQSPNINQPNDNSSSRLDNFTKPLWRKSWFLFSGTAVVLLMLGFVARNLMQAYKNSVKIETNTIPEKGLKTGIERHEEKEPTGNTSILVRFRGDEIALSAINDNIQRGAAVNLAPSVRSKGFWTQARKDWEASLTGKEEPHAQDNKPTAIVQSTPPPPVVEKPQSQKQRPQRFEYYT